MQPCEPAHLIELPSEPSLLLEGMLFGRSNFCISKGTCNYLLPWGRGKGQGQGARGKGQGARGKGQGARGSFRQQSILRGGALKKIDRQREGIIRILKSQRRDQVNFSVATKIHRSPPPPSFRRIIHSLRRDQVNFSVATKIYRFSAPFPPPL